MNTTKGDRNRRVLIINDMKSLHDDFRIILQPDQSVGVALDSASSATLDTTETCETSHRPTFEVDSAYQGEEGLKLVIHALMENNPYALAFVGMRMEPGWDGLETIRRIWEVDPNLPIVICTANSDYTWEEMTKELIHTDSLLILKTPFNNMVAIQIAYTMTELLNLRHDANLLVDTLKEKVEHESATVKQLTSEVYQHAKVIAKKDSRLSNLINTANEYHRPNYWAI